MRINLEKRTEGRIEFGVIYGAIALLVLIAARVLPLLALMPQCAFNTLTGFPCPTCGSTRSLVHLARADFITALAMNPLICAGVLSVILVFFYSATMLVLDRPRISIAFSRREKDVIRVCALVIVIFNWFYLLFAL